MHTVTINNLLVGDKEQKKIIVSNMPLKYIICSSDVLDLEPKVMNWDVVRGKNYLIISVTKKPLV